MPGDDLSGRYTAGRIYPRGTFQAAQAAGTAAYVGSGYGCAHSQRGYLFQFGNFGERNHWDGPVSTCCDEPVANFSALPQYSGRGSSFVTRDCTAAARGGGDCLVVDVVAGAPGTYCASGAGSVSLGVAVGCAAKCGQVAGILSGGGVRLGDGVLSGLAVNPAGRLSGRYYQDASVAAAWWAGCSGSGTVGERICGRDITTATYLGGLDFPGGCGCDCCGVSGVMAYPASVVGFALVSGTPTWGNTWAPGGVKLDPACSGGVVSGWWSGGWGASGFALASGAVYVSDGSTRLLSGTLGTVGSATASACCGGRVVVSGWNGCGSGYSGGVSIAAKSGVLGWLPASGTGWLYGATASFSGVSGCSYTSAAGITLSTECLTNNTYSSITSGDGWLKRGVVGALAFSGTIPCNNCCGSGTIRGSYSGGCGTSISGVWPVRRATSTSATVIGSLVKCYQVYSGGYRYYPVYWALNCNGASGVSGWFGGYYSTWADCTASISGTASSNLRALCSAVTSGTTCCAAAWNSLYSGSFEARVRVAYGALCCSGTGPAFQGWIYSGSTNCCTGMEG